MAVPMQRTLQRAGAAVVSRRVELHSAAAVAPAARQGAMCLERQRASHGYVAATAAVHPVRRWAGSVGGKSSVNAPAATLGEAAAAPPSSSSSSAKHPASTAAASPTKPIVRAPPLESILSAAE
jgi:hypothetical protein